MRATCHTSNVQQRFYSGFLSLSHIVVIVLWVLAFALPLFLALGSREFVLQTNSYQEQPVIKSMNQVLCILEGERAKQPLTLVHTTFPEHIQRLFINESLQAARVKTSSIDDNSDGIAESIWIEIAMPLSVSDVIRQATVVVVLDYKLENYAKLNMDVMVVFSHSSLNTGDTLDIDGDLDLHQRNALKITDSIQQPYITSPIVNMTTTDTTQEQLVQSLYSEYRKRNYTAYLHVPFPVWKVASNTSEAERMFRVSMTIRNDKVNVVYTPEWPEIVKHAWIQYYCIFIFVSTLIFAIREYLFKHKLLSSVCIVDETRRGFNKYI
ncbi:putative transmembrane protein [Plasmopara halstedii]